jgi:excisionase family DNA binding protein
MSQDVRHQDDPHLVSLNVAAGRVGVGRDTIRRRITSGDLTGYRFGPRPIRVDMREVDALLRPIPTAGTVA